MISIFPTYASRTPDGRWRVNVAGMVVRPLPATSRRRSVAIAVLKRVLELEPEDVRAPLFQKRATAFFFQRVAGRRVEVRLDGRLHSAGATDRVGHFAATLEIDDRTMERLRGRAADAFGRSIDCRVEEGGTDRDEFGDDDDGSSAEGRIHVVEPTGFSIVSDIDDTVKDSNVIDKRELLANTFVREFRPIDDVVEAFRRFERSGTAFHYVSASPWQLAGCLGDFFERAGLPGGSMHLKLFRLKDSTPLGRFPSRKRSKRRAVERILADFPERRFLLVGDSGELDPEVYASVARRHPEQIVGIAIRLLQKGEALDAVRHRIGKLSGKLPAGLLETFTRAEEAFPSKAATHSGLSNAF